MNVLKLLTSNYIINVGVISLCSAHLLKLLFTFMLTKKWQFERLCGSGGMPSSHSALSVSIAIALARKLGFASPVFGLALAFAAIVMYDAMGVRRAAGEQAKVLNKMLFEFPLAQFFGGREDEDNQDDSEKEAQEDTQQSPKMLKEYLGHTPLEVLGGCLLGILVAMFVPVS